MSKARKKVFPKQVSRAEFVSRGTSQNHISGTCECEHHASLHRSAAFQDCPVKRCSMCRCADFKVKPSFFRNESSKSRQDQRKQRHATEYLRTSHPLFATKRKSA